MDQTVDSLGQASPASSSGWRFNPGQTSILVIDDEEANRDILQRLLERAGFPCECAANGSDGLLQLDSGRFDLVVCDVRLPDASGLDICRDIKSRQDTRHIFVALISSAETSSISTVAGLDSGADEYIARPIRNEELVARIHALARIQQTTRALRESERRFITLAKTAPAGIMRTDIHGKIVYVNDYWSRLTGLPSDQVLGKDWHIGLHEEDIHHLIEAFEEAATEQRPMKTECRLRRSDGELRWVLSTASAEFDTEGTLCGYIGTLIDISERKTAEDTLASLNSTLEKRIADRTATLARTNDILVKEITERKRAEAALKQLPHRIMEAQENERRRLARELHDGVSQILASIRFRCQMFTERLGPDMDESLRSELDATHRHLETALREVRNISHDLRPSELDDLGIVAAIRSLADHFRERTGIEVEITASRMRSRLAADVELALYRILQEAFTNIERHAGARHINVSLEKQRRSLTLTVSDDGCGFAIGSGGAGCGLGLVNMRERADFIGGTLALRSVPRSGTTVEVFVPIHA